MSSDAHAHLKASEAIGLLNKIKWANLEADDRLIILEKLQKKLTEEMEDLGIEEAEMKNAKVATTDNLYAADATRLTSVIPLAFALSNAIEMYRLNLNGKAMNPVGAPVKVQETAYMLDFGKVETADTSNDSGGEGGRNKELDASELPAAEEEKNVDSSSVNDNNESGEKMETQEAKADKNPTSPSDKLPVYAPSEPPADSPPEPPQYAPPEPLAGSPPADIPPEPPSDVPLEPTTDAPPESLADAPQELSEPHSEGGNEKAEDDNDDDINTERKASEKEMHSENVEAVAENGEIAATSQETACDNGSNAEEGSDGKSVEALANNEKPDSIGESSNPENSNQQQREQQKEEGAEEFRNIKIMFDPDDEFVIETKEDFIAYHDILVSPRTWNEKGYFNSRQERLRVAGDPEHRVGPYDRRDPKTTAILGASCYSAASEIIKATFLDGHVVVYKPHPYNVDIDRIWFEIMKPLVEAGALSYCEADQGPELVQDPRIDQIYLTGTEETAKQIKELTESKKSYVFQTGSVNPVILVPSLHRPWKSKEMRHHALQIASAGKFNGGHFCGRPQIILTSKEWVQRDEFLKELRKAISDRTPPEASYDPKYQKMFKRFVQEYPNGKVLKSSECLETEWAKMLLVTGATIDSYGLKNEAFCQVLIEVPLNVTDHPAVFLPEAVKFCNEKLYGSLCATVVVDDSTSKQYNGIIQHALSDLKYGTVSINAMACFGWFNPSLYWGNYKKKEDDGKESGVGHFGNLLGYEHAVKSVITDSFTGNGHFIKTCRGAYSEKIASLSYYAVEPTMKKVTAYKMRGVKAAAARKDW